MIITQDPVIGWRAAETETLASDRTQSLRVFAHDEAKEARERLVPLRGIEAKELEPLGERWALASTLLFLVALIVLFALKLPAVALGLIAAFAVFTVGMIVADRASGREEKSAQIESWKRYVVESSQVIPDGLPLGILRSENDLLAEKLSKLHAIEARLAVEDLHVPHAIVENVRGELEEARRTLLGEIRHALNPAVPVTTATQVITTEATP